MRPRKLKGKTLTKSEQMARVRNKNTRPEILLRKALWDKGYRYRLHPALPGTPDIAFIGIKVAVFVDGCFWHGCPDHYTQPVTNSSFWKNKLKRNIDRDRFADLELGKMGWAVIRVWDHEVIQNIDNVIERIKVIIDTRKGIVQ